MKDLMKLKEVNMLLELLYKLLKQNDYLQIDEDLYILEVIENVKEYKDLFE